MSSGNRTTKYESLYKSLKKHYKPVSDPPERSVLECMLYACCLEDARLEQADEAFAKLQQTYFDWNEVRVTTVSELAEALKALPFPAQAAVRIKQCLQSVFEARYQYDIDDLKKANLGKAVAEIEAWKGITPFVVAYVSQHSLGGHAIPAGQVIYEAMWQCEILTFGEIDKKSLPGIERAIPKNKGIEFAGLLHQFANELFHHPKATAPLSILKELGVVLKAKPKPVVSEKESSKGSGSKSSSAAAGTSPSSGSAASAAKPVAGSSEKADDKSASATKNAGGKSGVSAKATVSKDQVATGKGAEKESEKTTEKSTAKSTVKSSAKPTEKGTEKGSEKDASKSGEKSASKGASGKSGSGAVKPSAKLDEAKSVPSRPKPKVQALGKGPLAKGAIKASSGTKGDAGGSGKPTSGKSESKGDGKSKAKPDKSTSKSSKGAPKDSAKKPAAGGKSDAKKPADPKKSGGKSSDSLGSSLTKKKPK
jgi:hypothetical protein